MKKKKLMAILFVLLLIAFGVLFIEKKFVKPYDTIERFVNDAKENKNISKYLIEEDKKWMPLKAQSKYSLIREELDWKHFKDAIDFKEAIRVVCKEEYSFFYKIKNLNRKEASPMVYLYDSTGNELMNIRILMLKVNNAWKVIGTADDRDIEFVNKSEVSLSDIEEYLKDGHQVNMKLLNEKLNIHSSLFNSERNTIKIADKIEAELVPGEKMDTVLLLLTQRGFKYQFLVFNKEKNDYNFIGYINFGYKLGYEDEALPIFRIVEIDDNHKYIVIKTQAGYGTGINIKNERWYRINRDKISKVLEYPIDYVTVPPPTVGFPIKVDGKVIKSEVIDGKPMVDVDFTISYIYEMDYKKDKKVSIDKTIRYIWKEDGFVSEEYKTNNDGWIVDKRINNEILEKNFDKLIMISESDDEHTMDYLLRFLESCEDSSKKNLLLDKARNYPYIKSENIESSALVVQGVSFGASFNYKNLSEDIKKVSLWYQEFNKGILISDERFSVCEWASKDGTLGFNVASRKDGSRKITMSTGTSVSTDIDEIENKKDFIAVNTDKIRIKKDKEILLGFIVWGVENTANTSYSIDNIESIIDCFPDKKIFILKCRFID